jgi:hypothetical protein
MPNTQLGDTQKVSYKYGLNDADSNFVPLPAGATVSVTSGATASATVVPDATPTIHNPGQPNDGQPDPTADASGFILGGATLATGVSITFSCLAADGTTKIVPDVVDLIDIVPGAATTAAVSLGTPIAQ